jgi:VanZ family protein
MVPGRFGTIVDVVLNAIGAVLGLLAALILL